MGWIQGQRYQKEENTERKPAREKCRPGLGNFYENCVSHMQWERCYGMAWPVWPFKCILPAGSKMEDWLERDKPSISEAYENVSSLKMTAQTVSIIERRGDSGEDGTIREIIHGQGMWSSVENDRPGGTEWGIVLRDWILQHHRVGSRVLEVKMKEQFYQRANKWQHYL